MNKTFSIHRPVTYAVLASLCTPMLAYAATKMTLADLVEGPILDYLYVGLELLMAVAALSFVFYTVKYFVLNDGGEKRKEAGQYLLYSILGFFIIISFWGLVHIVQNSFGLSNQDNTPGSWGDFTNIFPRQ